MAYIYVLAAITAVLSVVVVALENKGILALKYVLKTVASLCFVMIALLSMAKGGYDNWKILVIAGLVFGMLGDIFLSSNNVVADKKTLGVLTIAGGLFFCGRPRHIRRVASALCGRVQLLHAFRGVRNSGAVRGAESSESDESGEDNSACYAVRGVSRHDAYGRD